LWVLAWINDEADRVPTIEELFAMARRGEAELVSSVLSQVEVAFAADEQASGALDPEIETKLDNLWKPGSPLKPVEFHDLIARDARRLVRRGIEQNWGKLKPPDAIHLATAERMDVDRFHTYDERLLKWDGSVSFPISEPMTAQAVLDVRPVDGSNT
jgi:predicted nucleic acid-binding protein